MLIEIPFNKWSKDRFQLGMKHATSRTKKYGSVGDTFTLGNKTYEITLILKLPLWFIKSELYITEGCLYPEEFEEIWKSIHPIKGCDENQIVWYHYFKEK
jgi:hypothetical protein